MKINFYKYHGAGNDFVIIDNRNKTFDKTNTTLINQICNRRIGVGADGLILLEKDDNTDFRMVYYNADGNESTMCGNGGRCIVAFAKKLGIIEKKTSFFAIDGIHNAEIDINNNVNLHMKDVSAIQTFENDHVMDTGSPHYVKIVSSFPDNFITEAKKIRNSKKFLKEGINVNFIRVTQNKIQIRTYERGVEDETLACGTGCVAAALSIMKKEKINSEILLKAKGGNLRVRAVKTNNGFKDIWLYGPTKYVFKGFFNKFS